LEISINKKTKETKNGKFDYLYEEKAQKCPNKEEEISAYNIISSNKHKYIKTTTNTK
jgi:hypothetical protein